MLYVTLFTYVEGMEAKETQVTIDLRDGFVSPGEESEDEMEMRPLPEALEDNTGGFSLTTNDTGASLLSDERELTFDLSNVPEGYIQLEYQDPVFFVSPGTGKAYIFYQITKEGCTTEECERYNTKCVVLIVDLETGGVVIQEMERLDYDLLNIIDYAMVDRVYDDERIATTGSPEGCGYSAYLVYNETSLISTGRLHSNYGFLGTVFYDEEEPGRKTNPWGCKVYRVHHDVACKRGENGGCGEQYVTGYSIDTVSILTGEVIKSVELNKDDVWDAADWTPPPSAVTGLSSTLLVASVSFGLSLTLLL
jgi:hypothetical protein